MAKVRMCDRCGEVCRVFGMRKVAVKYSLLPTECVTQELCTSCRCDLDLFMANKPIKSREQ